jgi:hypothetical protein
MAGRRKYNRNGQAPRKRRRRAGPLRSDRVRTFAPQRFDAVCVGYGLPYRLQNLLCDQRNELLFCYSLQLPKSCSHAERYMPLKVD